MITALALIAALSVTPTGDGVTINNDTDEAVYVQVSDSLTPVPAGTTWTVGLTRGTIVVDGLVYWAVWSEDGDMLAAGTYDVAPEPEEKPNVTVDLATLVDPPRPPTMAIRMHTGVHPI